MTVRQLLSTVSSEELTEWGVYHKILESEVPGTGDSAGIKVQTMHGSNTVKPD